MLAVPLASAGAVPITSYALLTLLMSVVMTAFRPKVVKVVFLVKTKPIYYIQLYDGDKTMLIVQASRVSAPNFVSSTSF
jgi:hypothetical protein